MSGASHPHLEALREAWWEFKESVGFEAFCLYDDDEGESGRLPYVYAWLCAPWRPLLWRFSRRNLERLFRPLKAERRQRLADKSNYVFWCSAEGTDDEWWAEADALVAEFGGEFPPRDWEPVSAAEAVGMGMGYTREGVAGILAEPRAAIAKATGEHAQ